MNVAIVVTGSRSWTDAETIYKELWKFKEASIVIHGDANGADSIAAQYAANSLVDIKELPMPAQWDKHGKKAGSLRNEAMAQVVRQLLATGWQVHGFAFPMKDSIGTFHAMRLLKPICSSFTVCEKYL